VSQPVIQATDINVKRQDKWVLRHVDLTLHPGEIMTLIGPNGSGKTTLLKVILGLVSVQSGQVVKRPKLRVGYMPQRLHIESTFPMDVQTFLQLGKKRLARCVTEKMQEVGVLHIAAHPIQRISGGELQRVLLARALLMEPDVLILDEPTQGVDVNGQAELYQLIGRIRAHYHCAVLMVSHDLHLVMAATDQVICLNNHVCCFGHPHNVSQHPAYLSLFGDGAKSIAIYTHKHDHQHQLDGSVRTDV